MTDGPWFGAIPAGWKSGSIRRFAYMRTGHTPSRSTPEYWVNCDIPWFTLGDVWQLRAGARHLGDTAERISPIGLANSAADLLPAGTVVLSRTASVGFTGIMPIPMATSQDYWNWVPREGLLSEYLWYQFQAMKPEFDRLMMGSTHRTIYQGDAANLRIVVPPEPSQREIVDFLDRETAQIDAFIAKNEELITLLTERRAAIRGDLAAGGDQPGPRKPSGLFWAPEVSDDWQVVPLTSVAKLESGHTPSKTRPEFWRDDECVIPWISLNDVGSLTSDEYITSTVNRISPAGLAGSSARMLPEGTVVLSRDATIGRSSIMAQPMATSQHFADWVCGDRLLPRYLWLLFTSCMQGMFDSLTNGSTIRTIGVPDLRSFRIPLPPLATQAQIVEAAAVKDSQLRETTETANRARKLAIERRAALISAAVTGKIDVGVGA